MKLEVKIMRLYVYISESVKLSDIVPIVESSKVSNASHGITGVLSYGYGHYLHVIEGEEAQVSNLIKNIRKDTRHQNITEILDADTDKRLFSDWSMNLVPLLKRNESFVRFVDFLNNNIVLLSRKQKRLMKIFYKLNETKVPTAKQADPLKPLSYSIVEWPDFDVVEVSSSLLSLCGALMNNPTHFRKLVNQKMYGAEDEIRYMLNQLNHSGYLKVTQVQPLEKNHVSKAKDGKEQRGYLDRVWHPRSGRMILKQTSNVLDN